MKLALPARLAVVALVLTPVAGWAELPKTEGARQLEELIRQLSSPKFPEREEAARKLTDLPAAAPALRKLARAADADTARQASRILEGIAKKRIAPLGGLLKAAAKEGRADLLTERVVRWPGEQDDPDCWQPSVEFAAKVADLWWKGDEWTQRNQRDRFISFMPLGDFRSYVKKAQPNVLPRQAPEVNEQGPYLFRGDRLTAKATVAGSLIATADSASVDDLGYSVLLANGTVTFPPRRRGLGRSIIVCDGDVEIRSELNASVVVARGAVTCSGRVSSSLILAGRVNFTSEYPFIWGTTIKTVGAMPKLKVDPINKNVFEGDVANAFDFVKFFETADVGVKVAAAEKGVRVEEVAGGKPFAKAGLQKGDVVLTVDGDKAESPESFRRLLRRAAVQGDGTFEVRRGDKMLELTAFFPD